MYIRYVEIKVQTKLLPQRQRTTRVTVGNVNIVEIEQSQCNVQRIITEARRPDNGIMSDNLEFKNRERVHNARKCTGMQLNSTPPSQHGRS